jgi:hypothetical protein
MLAREIHGKRFRTRENAHGRSGAETVFEYFVAEGDIIHGAYAGGEIRTGQLVGRVTGEDRIEMRFQCVTTSGDLLSGRSSGRVSRDADGRVCLDFDWVWLSGQEGGSYVEAAAGE